MYTARNRKIEVVKVVLLSMYLFVTGFSFVAAQAAATPAKEYTVLAPLPGTTGAGGTANLSTYLPGLFNLLIGVGAVAAFVIITIFGFEYMLTDSLVSKQNARTWLENALWGLGLLIFAYAILYTVNPNLVKGSLNITTPNVTTSGSITAGNPCSGGSPTACTEEQNLEAGLKSFGIDINSPCTQTSCITQITALTDNTVTQLMALDQACNCKVTITGGNEPNVHSATGGHPVGTSVDLASNATMNTYLGVSALVDGQTVTKTVSGQTVTFKYEVLGGNASGSSTGPHWHTSF